MQTSAIVFKQANDPVWQPVTVPPPSPGEVQLRTQYSTISGGTEGWVLANRFTWMATIFPCVPGYQRVGVITALGAGVTGWRVGENAAATLANWQLPVSAVNSMWGAHAAVANTLATELYRLPAGLDPVDASGLVVAQVGYNAASRAALAAGDWVLVFGDGLIGQCAAQAARARGARVILAGHRPERLRLGQAHSADAIIDTRAENMPAAVRKLTGCQHVTAVLDTVQSEAAQRQYLELLEHGRGQIVYCGFTPGTAWADMAVLQQRELTTHFISGWSRTRLEATLELLAQGRMRLRPLITHLVPASQGPAMYRLIAAKAEPFLGITLDWQGEGRP